ncbi:MAG TPA: phosphate ABC transporter substrate-binding protein PstS [Candidatus Limnocylindrales bacterium]|nr:phosphate ABC transporter substrate-binding protein PstS [Candidatus Limnocylindrales bacterium]
MKRAILAMVPAVGILLAACGSTSNTPASSPAAGFTIPTPPAANLIGAGSTFDYPFFNAAFYAYNQKFSDVTVNYQSIGSGGGIQQLTKKTVDFGASDVPLKTSEADAMGGADAVVQIPVTLGAVSLAYNLQGVGNGQLKLTPDLIAGIFLGSITTWNDPAITAVNSGLSLPSQPINVVHRSDASGTTYIFTDYLSNVSPEWKTKIGVGKSVSWKTGGGQKGNEAVAAYIKQTPGAIGYVELAYVVQTNMTQARLKNADGNFVLPSAAGATAAAAAKPNVTPTDFSIVNAPGKDSAPIAGYSWAMLYKDQTDKTKGQATVDLLYWLISPDGQQYAANLNYAKLPDNIAKADVATLKTVTSGGTALLTVS